MRTTNEKFHDHILKKERVDFMESEQVVNKPLNVDEPLNFITLLLIYLFIFF